MNQVFPDLLALNQRKVLAENLDLLVTLDSPVPLVIEEALDFKVNKVFLDFPDLLDQLDPKDPQVIVE